MDASAESPEFVASLGVACQLAGATVILTVRHLHHHRATFEDEVHSRDVATVAPENDVGTRARQPEFAHECEESPLDRRAAAVGERVLDEPASPSP